MRESRKVDRGIMTKDAIDFYREDHNKADSENLYTEKLIEATLCAESYLGF
jgi:hypothetical protein